MIAPDSAAITPFEETSRLLLDTTAGPRCVGDCYRFTKGLLSPLAPSWQVYVSEVWWYGAEDSDEQTDPGEEADTEADQIEAERNRLKLQLSMLREVQGEWEVSISHPSRAGKTTTGLVIRSPKPRVQSLSYADIATVIFRLVGEVSLHLAAQAAPQGGD